MTLLARLSPEEKTARSRSEAAQKAAKTRAYNKQVKGATARREQYEADNPARFKDHAGALADRMRNDPDFISKVKRSGRDVETEITRNENFARQAGPGATYDLMGWRGHDSHIEHPDQGVLIDHPHAIPNPTRWEDLSEDTRADTLKRAATFGVSMESARHAYSTQLDRAMVREDGRHQSFYSEEGTDAEGNLAPRSRLRQSAVENEVPFHHQVMANALTSPNSRFVVKNKQTGKVTYPNDESASLSIQWAKEGHTGDEYLHHPDYYVPVEEKIPHPKTGKPVKAPDDSRGYPVQGYPANNAKAIDTERKLLDGASPQDAWPGGKQSAQKIGPYYNAWVAPTHPEGQFFVSDTHSGGAGFAPHLTEAEQVQYMNHPGTKALHDFLARDVNRERGLVSVNRAQSAQWNQEKLEQGHGEVSALTHRKVAKKVSPASVGNQFKQDSLF